MIHDVSCLLVHQLYTCWRQPDEPLKFETSRCHRAMLQPRRSPREALEQRLKRDPSEQGAAHLRDAVEMRRTQKIHYMIHPKSSVGGHRY